MAVLKKLPMGIESFEEIRKDGFYYVDKTGLIKILLENWGKASLFTRPRRFGKSLNMSMLQSFLKLAVKRSCLAALRLQRRRSSVKNIWGNFRSFPSV